MKEIPTPTPSDDAHDPLLAALQQRLGNYGAAPPPGAWAGIRQRLPAPPRPWWRRPRRLLPLLALLLGLVVTTTMRLGRGPGSVAPLVIASKTTAASSGHATTRAQTIGSLAKKPAQVAQFQTLSSPTQRVLGQPDKAAKRRAEATTTHHLTASSRLANSLPQKRIATTLGPATPGTLFTTVVTSPAQQAAAGNPPARVSTAKSLAQFTAKKRTKNQANKLLAVDAGRRGTPAARAATTGPRVASRSAVGATQPQAHMPLALHKKLQAHPLTSPAHHYQRVATRPPLGDAPTLNTTATRTRPESTSLFGLASRRRYAYTTPDHAAHTSELQPAAALAVDTLGLHSVGLLLPLAPPLPAPLVGRPDSLPPAGPVRRWALLAVAGPTLGYRTLGATTPAATPAMAPNFARLERPALGFGAQVQGRRVLSGRWALAVGLGYQEYATRLALQVTTDTTSASVHQRDTYRLLTLPVQLGYALGAPHGRFAKAVLMGAEVGWYKGGRSTEGSDCGCHQTTYSATASPYRPRTLALSLGLDLRYRVGGSAGRWEWVVQPTGRYVLTPFTLATMAGFTARQPFSLGLLTGFSWDIR
jgi:hypothetical protein